MTDKQLAEEYEKVAEYVEIDDYGHKVYDSLDIEQAYLAGLKEGRPKWHDLRKNPNDLPTSEIDLDLDMYPGFIKSKIKPRIKVIAELFFKGYSHLESSWEEILYYEDDIWLRPIQGTAGRFLKKIPKSVYVLRWCELP